MITKVLSIKQSVGFYIEFMFKKKIIEIFCEFLENGNIIIKFECPILLTNEDVNVIIKRSINDTILEKIRNYLKQSGYEYITYNDINSDNIEINKLDYQIKIENKKKIDISKYIGCISSIFNIIKGKAISTSDVLKLVYKRVSVFKLMDSIKSFITIKRNAAEDWSTIITQLKENFPKTIEDDTRAKEIIAEWNSEILMKESAYGNKNRIIDSNPGFETTMSTVIADKTYTNIIIEGINDTKYIQYIEIYIDSIFKILKSTFAAKMQQRIKKVCVKKSKKIQDIDDIGDKDIKTKLVSGKIVFGKASVTDSFFDDPDDDGEFDDFFDDDDEDEF